MRCFNHLSSWPDTFSLQLVTFWLCLLVPPLPFFKARCVCLLHQNLKSMNAYPCVIFLNVIDINGLFRSKKSTSNIESTPSFRIFSHKLIQLRSLPSNFIFFQCISWTAKISCWNKKAATIKVICLTASKGFTLIKSMYREQYIQTTIFHSRLHR